MKKLSPKTVQRFKNVGLLVTYWLIFVGIPDLIMQKVVSNSHCANAIMEKRSVSMFAYAFLLAMIVFILPYKLAKFPSKIEKIFFIFIGLLAPLLGVCLAILGSALMCPDFTF